MLQCFCDKNIKPKMSVRIIKAPTDIFVMIHVKDCSESLFSTFQEEYFSLNVSSSNMSLGDIIFLRSYENGSYSSSESYTGKELVVKIIQVISDRLIDVEKLDEVDVFELADRLFLSYWHYSITSIEQATFYSHPNLYNKAIVGDLITLNYTFLAHDEDLENASNFDSDDINCSNSKEVDVETIFSITRDYPLEIAEVNRIYS